MKASGEIFDGNVWKMRHFLGRAMESTMYNKVWRIGLLGTFKMDNSVYQDWWQLHLRLARGEVLTSEERDAYQAGLSSLECEESLSAMTDVRQARQQWIALDREYSALEQRRQQLDSEIAAVESRLSEHTRQYLGVED